jgi:hypothetical protein
MNNMEYPKVEKLSTYELQMLLNSCDGSFNINNYKAFAFATVGTTYSIDRFVKAILSLKNLKSMSNFATAKAGKDVRVLAHPDNQCFSYDDWYTGMTIKLGREFYQDTFNDRSDVPAVDIRTKYVTIASVLYGAYYHELFHVLYTPFKYAYDQTKRCSEYFRSFAHQVSNILEDVTIEGTGCNRYDFAIPYIDAIKQCFTQESQLDMVRQAITNEPDSPGTMLAYLLHFCRDTDMSQFPEYKLWADHKDFIEWGAYKCINTIDPFLRTRRQLAYAMELCKILEMKEPSKDNMENPNMSQMESESQGLTQKSMGGLGTKATKPLNSFTDVSSKGPSYANTPLEETDDDIKTPEKLTEMKAGRSPDGSTSSSESPVTSDLTKEGITIMANDDPVSRYSHFTDKLSKYVNTQQYLPSYNKIVEQFEPEIRKVVAIIRKMTATNNSSWNHYKMKGKVDSSTFYKKGNYKIFKQRNAPSSIADLVISALIDGSGSMFREKARLAGIALIIFCEALHRLHIPFSVNVFTEANAAITINLKDYNESYEKTKTNLTLFIEQFNCNALGTWCGNIDEINLQYVSQELLQRKEKDKVLIVISDGATCGSWKDLKQTAENIEAQGVTMLGIGIFDDNVKRIYKNHVILKEQKDLEMLGAFLNKYLIGKIFK